MSNRRILLACAVLLLVAIPLLAYAAISDSKELETFLELRTAVLEKLHANATTLPDGIESRFKTRRDRKADPPGSDHIRSVVCHGNDWQGDGYASYELTLSDELSASPSEDLADLLIKHFSNGLEPLEMRSGLNGPGAIGLFGNRATAAKYWSDADHRLVASFSVVVDRDAKSAHIDRFVHEHFH